MLYQEINPKLIKLKILYNHFGTITLETMSIICEMDDVEWDCLKIKVEHSEKIISHVLCDLMGGKGEEKGEVSMYHSQR